STGYAYVVDGEGRLIAHHNPSLVLQGQDLSAMKVVRDALQGQAVAASYKGLEGQDVIGDYQPLRQADWFVLVETPSQEALANAREARTLNIAAVVGMCVLATFLGWYATRVVRTGVQGDKEK
ncbi:MAG: Cache 3/Cache 2 fusion domain-containing protein, partial [Anaerolineae bacterium]